MFPCEPGGKAPLTRRGFHDATTDPAVIRQWWTRWPEANVAIPTGCNTADVLDVDVRPSGNGWTHFNRAKRAGLLDGATRVVQTPSGGLHCWFPGTSQGCSSLRGKHIDFKATGGYVLVPPSHVTTEHYAGEYVELQHRDQGRPLDWPAVRRLLDPPRQYRPMPAQGSTEDVGRFARWLSGVREGEHRNNALFWAACRTLDHGQPNLEELARVGVAIGLTEHEVRNTLRSARRTIGGAAA